MTRPAELSVVTLKRDLPEFGLRAGNVGTVVLVFEPDALEVEFFDRDGDTHAMLTVLDDDVRPATNAELESHDQSEPWPEGVDVPIADITVRSKQ